MDLLCHKHLELLNAITAEPLTQPVAIKPNEGVAGGQGKTQVFSHRNEIFMNFSVSVCVCVCVLVFVCLLKGNSFCNLLCHFAASDCGRMGGGGWLAAWLGGCFGGSLHPQRFV